MEATTEVGRRAPGEAGQPGRTGVLAFLVGLVLLAAACGASPGASSSPSASTASAGFSTRLAFARCVRAHGVPTYPDPYGNGLEPPGTKELFIGNSRFRPAVSACRHLLPNGGHPTQAPQANALSDTGALRLARCMRTHGYPAFPDPTIDSVGQPVFNMQAAGIAPHTPQLLATLRGCLSLLHLSGLPQTSS
jgi:hypothetical protein